MSNQLRFTIHDFEHLPEDNANRYEIIDGELYVSTVTHFRHQMTSDRFVRAFQNWSDISLSGIAISLPGVIFAEDDAVIPDLVWISRERFDRILGDDGKLHAPPDLVVEILSPGPANEARDLEIKLKLYSRQGVREYWIVDWRDATVRVYRREKAVLHLIATLTAEDNLESPLLPGFSQGVGDVCSSPI
jgi:Uma2 family endonuclease